MRKALQWLGVLLLCCLGTTIQAQINTFPYTQDFETFTDCSGGNNCGNACPLPAPSGWENPTAGDDNDWIVNQGGTPTGSSGPNGDHTTGSGNYIYVEASGSCHPSTRSDLLSPVFDFTAVTNPRVTFWYHMRGNNMGTTSIDISTDGGSTWTNDIVTPITDNLDQWQLYTLNLYDVGGTSYGGLNNIRLRFRGITGTVNWESDMAMDDFSVTAVPAVDAALTAVVSPTAPICGTSPQNVAVTIQNTGVTTLTSADINWTVNGVAQPTVNWTGSLASGTSTNFTVGSTSIGNGDVVSLTVSNPNGGTDGNAANNTVSESFFLGLSGTYTIGGSAGPANYADFSTAVTDLVNGGVCGPVVFNVASGSYNENIVIDDIPGASATNNILFQSAAGDSTAVELRHFASGGADNYTVRFDGGSHITFRQMTIANTGNNYSRVLVYNQGSSYINIANCIIEGNINVTNNNNNRITIYSNDDVNDYCTFTDNVIQGGSYYMFFEGENNGARERGTVIRNNTFQFGYYRGLDLRYHEETEIVGNDITMSSSYGGNTRWIELRDMGHIEVAYNNLTGTNRGWSFDCNNCDAPVGNPSYIYNNSIYVGRVSGTDASRGIFMENSENNYVENNSIHIENNSSNSVGIRVSGGGTNYANNNNILITGFGMGLHYDDLNDITGSNNNNVFVTSSFGNFGFFNGGLRPTLSDWQTVTGLDGNTLNVDPQYYSNTDLRICNTALQNAGMPLPYLTDDITGAPRIGLPDIGAYELVESGFTLGADTAKCIGDPVTLAVPDSDRFTGFSWNTGATTADITVTTPGIYHVTATAVCGTSVDTIEVTDIPNPVAAFSSSVSFLTSNFTDASTDADTYSWDFGDGNSATAQNPSHTYAAEDTYTVELTASNVCASDVASASIEVCLPIDVDFTSSSTGLSVNFSDATSTAVTAWAWDFGDGNTSTMQNPSHSYTADGVYDVQLIVTNPCGDQDSLTQSITVCAPITADFTETVVDRTINFTDTSTGTPVTWSWDFGDGATSTQQNPSHTYSSDGIYDVTLTVTNFCGQSSTSAISSFTVCEPISASISASNTGLAASFTDASSGTPTVWNWNFGDGNTSTLQNPNHTYAADGNYTVSLTIENLCGQTASTSTVVSACEPMTADFTEVITNRTIDFTDATTGTATNWAWDFGDGNTSTLQNPSHTYNADDTYTVTLTTTNICGETATTTETFTVCEPLTAAFNSTQTNRVVDFTDATTGTPTNWTWDFGDGNTDNGQNPQHTYAADGAYPVSLTVGNLCGLTSTITDTVTVCNPINADFSSSNTGLAAVFTDNTTGTATTWAWDFGDGNTSTLQNPSHTYASDGNYTVTLTTTNLCGQSSNSSMLVSACEPMTADFTEVITNRTIDFTDATIGTPTNWAWDFGDGNTSTLQNPSHTYNADDTYTVTLTTTNICGETATTTATYTVCEPLTAAFNSTQTNRVVDFTDATTGTPTSWTWDFGDGNTDNGQNPQHTYAADGAYLVSLTAENLCGLTSTITDTITVCNPITADFSSSSTGLATSFTDNTTGTPISWAWDFGDGNSSTLQNPSHNYANDGTYTVTLTTTNFCGQSSVEVQIVTVCEPITAGFTNSTNNLNVTFIDNTTGTPTSWDWTFGDGNGATVQNPAHTYSSDGVYTVNLIAENFCGQTSSSSSIITICDTLIAGIGSSVSGLNVNFTDNSSSGEAVSWSWDFGDGNSSTAENPTHTYANDGNYTVTLTATNLCGQSSTSTITVDACAPMAASFSSSSTGLSASFSDLTTGTPTAWAWDFGDGNTATVQNPTHTYAVDSTYTVTLTTTNTCGQTSTETQTITLCGALTANITQTSNLLTVDFSDASAGTPTSWFWDFGDGNSSALENPTHTYNTDGNYTVQLTVTNSCGQSSTSSPLSITVCDTLAASFNQTVNNLTVDFSSTTQGNPSTLFWNFGDGNTGTGANPSHTYLADGTYNVQLTATNLCGQSSTSVVVPLTVCDEMIADFSFTSSNLAVNFSDLTTGTPTAWAWDFGDGNTSTSANPNHTYAADSAYTVTLTTTNLCGLTSTHTTTVTVCDAMTASFSESINELQVAFTDGTTGTPTAWAWDFGDGNTSTGQNPTHIYSTDGTYPVTLTTTNLCGQSSTANSTITVCDSMQASFGTNVNALTVNFSDLTTANPTSWAWDFGDGNTSTMQSPNHTYATDGVYDVELIVTNFCGQVDTATATLTVCDVINAGFTEVNSGLTVNLTDTSAGNVATYLWNFGDGNTSALANPTHTYANSGSYSIILTVTNLCGISSTETLNVTVCGTVNADFAVNNNNLTINTTNTSTGGPTSYAWDFGDGTGTSTLTNPNYTYATDGTYNVTLIATSTCGGSDTSAPVPVTVCAPVTADYNFSVSNLTSTFTDASQGNPTGWNWDFGDGSGTSTLQNPIYTYSADGIYDVELIIQNICGDRDTINQTVTVCNTIGAGFTFSNNGLNVSFTDTSQGTPTSYAWNFGDNVGSSTAANPNYTYALDGAYPVTLTTTNSCGTSSITDTITVCAPMSANFSHTSSGLGRTISFNSTSTTGFPSTYFWDFGDGATSTAVNPTRIYATDGVYTVTLQTVNICGDTSTVTQTVNACQTLLPAFSVAANDLTISTTNNTQGVPTAYAWDFGDGNSSTATAPSHSYAADGTYTIALTVTNACGQSATDSFSVTVCSPMLADASAVDTALTVSFTDNSSGTPVAWAWDFGDGNSASMQNPVHSYTTDGAYPVSLLVTNLCGDTSNYNLTVTVCDSMQAAFNWSSNDLSASFMDMTSGNPTSYDWDFGDGNTSTAANPNHTYTADGSYIVSLTTTNFCGQSSTTTDTLELCAPLMADIGYSNVGLTADFSDLSMGTATTWSWDFGDGNTSTLENPNHSYAADGDYQVILTATNLCGLTSSDTLNITICADLVADFSFASTERTFNFINNSQGNASSTSWTFGDGVGASTQQNPTYTYPTSGQFVVTLTLTNFCGATSVMTDTVNAFLTRVEEQSNTAASLKLFPNPNDGQFALALEDWPTGEELELQLFDLYGQLVWMQQLDEVQNEEQLRIDVSQLPAGTYVLRATAGTTMMTYRVVIRR